MTRSQVFEILAEAYMELDPSGDYSEPQDQPSDADGSMPPETSGHAAGTDGEMEGETDGEAAEQPETAEPEQPVSVLSGFTDASSLEGKQRAAAELLVEAGIVNGDNYGRLNPSKCITRAEFVTMLYRIKDSGKAHAIKYDDSYADLADIKITVTGSDVKAGGTLKAQASLSGVPAGLPSRCH